MIFAYLLARRVRPPGRAGGAVGAMAFGLCATPLLRVPAGHWGVSCAIPWLALMLSLHRMDPCAGRTAEALLVGAFAVAMQVLSGMPQYVFITAISAGFYALIRPLGAGGPFNHAQGRAARWAMVAGMWLLGAPVAAVDLLPGVEAAAKARASC